MLQEDISQSYLHLPSALTVLAPLMQRNKFTVISHSASVTGAPLIASSLVDYISHYKNWNITLFFLSSSSHCSLPSLARQRRNQSVRVISGVRKTLYLKLIQVFLPLKRFLANVLSQVPQHQRVYDNNAINHIIYANSILSLKAGRQMKQFNRGYLVLHLHEMSYWISKASYSMKDLDSEISFVDLILAPSLRCIDALTKSSKTDLPINFKIIPEPSGIWSSPHPVKHLSLDSSNHIQSILSSAQSAGLKICVCNGTDSWRKGLDHFLRIAAYLNSKTPQKYLFVWVSLPLSLNERLQVEEECKLLGIANVIKLIPPVADFAFILKHSDCYVLTSREDPMPISALEAMVHGVPIVCFQNTGGIPDLLAESEVQVVPYGNVSQFGDSIMLLTNDVELKAAIIQHQYSIVQRCSPVTVYNEISYILDSIYES